MDIAYTIKIRVPTEANSPALALHQAGEKWEQTKAKFDEIGNVEVVRVTPVIEPKEQGANGTASGQAPARRQPAAATAE